jgi:RHS repeat-associated protein
VKAHLANVLALCCLFWGNNVLAQFNFCPLGYNPPTRCDECNRSAAPGGAEGNAVTAAGDPFSLTPSASLSASTAEAKSCGWWGCGPLKVTMPSLMAYGATGDPVVIPEGTTYLRRTDIAVPTTTGTLEFAHFYTSDQYAWANQWDSEFERPTLPAPSPFGSDSATQSLRWWDSLQSRIHVGTEPYVVLPDGGFIINGTAWEVRDLDGQWIRYPACTAPCWASVDLAIDGARRDRLYWDGGTFVFVEDFGRHLLYEPSGQWGPDGGAVDRYYLTRIQNEQYANIATIQYALPKPGGTNCPSTGVGAVGVPYISTVTTSDGTQLLFNYEAINDPTLGRECVLSNVVLDGGDVVAAFTYWDAGFLSEVSWYDGGRTEEYAYPSVGGFTDFQVSQQNYVMLSQQTSNVSVSNVAVVSDYSSDLTQLGIGYSTSVATCPSGLTCCAACCILTYSRTVQFQDAGRGDGLPGDPGYSGVVTVFDMGSPGGMLHQPGILQTAGSCTVAGACSTGDAGGDWGCNTGAGGDTHPGYFIGNFDKRGNWTLYTYADSGTPLASNLQVSSIQWGASQEASPTGALEQADYTYSYGPSAEQQVATYSKPSTYGTGSDTTTFTYDSNNRLISAVEQGKTDLYASGHTWNTAQTMTRGAFFLDYLKCSGGSTHDPLHRTVETHGPCWLQGTSSTDCDTDGGAAPITQYVYYTSGQYANRLQQVIEYPASTVSSCSGGLTTTFSAYDARGQATSITDSNNVAYTLTYDEDRLVQVKLAQNGVTHQTNFGYDNGRLTYVEHPSAQGGTGLYDVTCYRSGTLPWSSGCTGGTYSTRPQWMAKATNSTGSSWTEAVTYNYWPDNSVSIESYYENHSGTPTLRRTVEHALDAQRRPTWDAVGDGGGSFSIPRGFDPADNLGAVGIPFNSPPAWCQVSGALSTLCTQLTYNRANRLGYIDEFPDGGSASDITTCIDRDPAGNIEQVCPGLTGGASACSGFNTSPPVASNCTSSPMKYQWDDFGNVVQATLPWTTDPTNGGAGTVHMQYDPLGNVIVKQTPLQQSNPDVLLYFYDQLGRLTEAEDSTGTPTKLFTLGYDSANGPPSACLTNAGSPCFDGGTTTNNNGRLALRNDNFGETWYAYDLEGRVIAEVRSRDGGCAGGLADNPTTTYGYNPDGVLTCMNTPFNRHISYSVSTTDRVTAVTVELFTDAGNINSQLISAVAWEPYGGLRGYQVDTLDGGNAAVEYMLGDDGANSPGQTAPNKPPSNCTSTKFPVAKASSSDFTGRLRTLAVSTGNFTPDNGTPSANIYKVGYTWKADQLVELDTCILDGGVPRSELFGYDDITRLTSASNPDPGDGGGAFTARSYAFTARSNLLSDTLDGCTQTPTYDSSPAIDILSATGICNGSSSKLLQYQYVADHDGHVDKKWPTDSYGTDWILSPNWQVSPQTPSELVFKSVDVGVPSHTIEYNYYIDAFGRRRLKVYPANNVSDEFFYSTGHALIVDQGNDSASSPTVHPSDEYIWLGGRPVVVVRGHMDLSWNRLYDYGSTGCSRITDTSVCGVYFQVTDNVGKPVLVLDGARRIAGEADYDPLGYPNRVQLDAETAHPYPANQAQSDLIDFKQPGVTPALTVQERVNYAMVDTYMGDGGCADTTDSSELLDFDHPTTVLAGPYDGAHAGQLWTPWVQPAAGHVEVTFVSGCEKYKSGSSCVCGGTSQATGVIVAAYEYRRSQSGATPYWTPLRFVGQYYDAETDLFENWNRYYEPQTGRYLQPDPLTSHWPGYYVYTAGVSGSQPNPYVYALGNPITKFDPMGLDPNTTPYKTVEDAARAAFNWAENDPQNESFPFYREYGGTIYQKPGDPNYYFTDTNMGNEGHVDPKMPSKRCKVVAVYHNHPKNTPMSEDDVEVMKRTGATRMFIYNPGEPDALGWYGDPPTVDSWPLIGPKTPVPFTSTRKRHF